MKNRWISNKNSFASWEIAFKTPETGQEFDNILAFMMELLNLADGKQLFRIEKTALSENVTNPLDYVQMVKNAIEQDKILHFFDGIHQTAGVISYYDKNGELIRGEVANMGELIVSLHGEHVQGRLFAYPASPIHISGTRLDLTTSNNQSVYAWINLFSNIWFPQVRDHLADELEIGIVDNTELAQINSTRLNEFLTLARAITLDFDGVWHPIPGEKHIIYTSLVTETGIRL